MSGNGIDGTTPGIGERWKRSDVRLWTRGIYLPRNGLALRIFGPLDTTWCVAGFGVGWIAGLWFILSRPKA